MLKNWKQVEKLAPAEKQMRQQKSEYTRRIQLVRLLSFGWIAAATCYFAVEAWYYSGLFEKLSEWQFTVFDQTWPMLTYCLLVGIFSIPGIMLFALAGMRRGLPEHTEPDVFRAGRTLRGLRLVGFGFAIASLACLLPIGLMPGQSGPVRDVFGSQRSDSLPTEGAVRISGDVLMSRMTTLEQNLVFNRRQLRLAPILPGPGERTVHYLVQVTPTDVEAARTGTTAMQFTGTLVKQGLPGSLRTLYRDAGIPLAEKVMVLYRYPGTMRRPYIVASMQCAIMAMIVLLAWFWQRRHLRDLEERGVPKKVQDVDTGMDFPDDSGLRPVKDFVPNTGTSL